MPFYDVSVPLTNDIVTYPGDPGIEINAWMSLENGQPANVSHLRLGAHTGTHVDAPAHFIQGARKLEKLALEVLIGQASVIEVPADRLVIDDEFVAQHCDGIERVLFKTRNSSFWNEPSAPFHTDFTYLSTAAAERLIEFGVKLVGIDYLSIEQYGQSHHETHLVLLAKEVIIVEGLDLRAVPAGNYELICLPLRLRSGPGDGSPVRAVLRTLD